MEMIPGRIDGREIRVPWGTTALAAARSLGLAIPTLCHHEGLPDEGNCWLCLVAVGGRLVTSCMYPLRDGGFEMFTDTDAVRRARRFVLELLVNRCPASPRLSALGAEYGVAPDLRFAAADGELCIRCGRCVRACAANGPTAIGLVGRGRARRVAGPFFNPPEDCVGCLACATVCPTGKITYTEKGSRRSIWGREFELIRCPACGEVIGTAEQFRWVGAATDPCPVCRRRATAEGLARAALAAPEAPPSGA